MSDLEAVAGAAGMWLSGADLRTLVSAWPFVEFDELQEAYACGDELETKWRLLLRDTRGRWRDLIETTHGRPALQSLFPIHGHGMFRLTWTSRDSRYDTPHVRAYGAENYELVEAGEVLARGGRTEVVDAYERWLAHAVPFQDT
ncbi:DUF6193 family natural product biosynthesis protein [Streptomyces sp. NPDC006393]|uniref:DUF6193 family natural product biosynthesis protein n=1 Tax=Streptomyces sp. NPDC006393 TaxID=3156763 RepID=UPI0033EDB45E